MVGSKIKAKFKIVNSAAAAAKFWVFDVGIKEVLVVKKLRFRRLAIHRTAAAKLKKSKIWFRGLSIIITASAKYKNLEYKEMTVLCFQKYYWLEILFQYKYSVLFYRSPAHIIRL